MRRSSNSSNSSGSSSGSSFSFINERQVLFILTVSDIQFQMLALQMLVSRCLPYGITVLNTYNCSMQAIPVVLFFQPFASTRFFHAIVMIHSGFCDLPLGVASVVL